MLRVREYSHFHTERPTSLPRADPCEYPKNKKSLKERSRGRPKENTSGSKISSIRPYPCGRQLWKGTRMIKKGRGGGPQKQIGEQLQSPKKQRCHLRKKENKNI